MIAAQSVEEDERLALAFFCVENSDV